MADSVAYLDDSRHDQQLSEGSQQMIDPALRNFWLKHMGAPPAYSDLHNS